LKAAGQPHSKTSRTAWPAGKRASVLDCDCPLPLYVLIRHAHSVLDHSVFQPAIKLLECRHDR
jgi:hypothetical protein